jgi:hypothetical protein
MGAPKVDYQALWTNMRAALLEASNEHPDGAITYRDAVAMMRTAEDQAEYDANAATRERLASL